MANGNGANGTLTPLRTISLSVALTIGVVGVGYSLISARLDEHWAEAQELRRDMIERTSERYRAGDAERDLALRDFRFLRNEQRIAECEAWIKEHREAHR